MQGGWNVTGDAYARDGDGYFFYQARVDDMIVSAGYNIAGPEVENALLAHPAVAECAVVGHVDATGLVKPKAFVVLQPGQELIVLDYTTLDEGAINLLRSMMTEE